jgi:D-cysteine desulfhydrase
VSLTRLPTRVHKLEHLAAEIGIDSLWIKRDDESGTLYGGNKPRKLELLLGEALARRKQAVMTFGGIGTHHGLATAICARAVGLRCILVLLRQPVTENVRRCLVLDQAAGAELHYGKGVTGVALEALRACGRELRHGQLPYIVPTGGTSAIGAIGYVNAAFELQAQVAAGELPEPDWIFVPLGSGGTVAGLVLGAKLSGLRTRVAAVLVTDILPPSAAKLARLARHSERSLRRLGADLPAVDVSAADFCILRNHLGSNYGAPTPAGRRARDLIEQLEGIHLETTYTAKCLAAMLDLVRTPPYRDRRILFWNTYSSVDPAPQLEPLPDWHHLPAVFHQFFVGPPLPA